MKPIICPFMVPETRLVRHGRSWDDSLRPGAAGWIDDNPTGVDDPSTLDFLFGLPMVNG